MAKRPGMMKLQIVIPPFVAKQMTTVPKNNRSVVVTYALQKLFASTDSRDVDFLRLMAPGCVPPPKTPGPISRSEETPPISGGDGSLPGTFTHGRLPVPGETKHAGNGINADTSEWEDLDAADIAGGLMDDD